MAADRTFVEELPWLLSTKFAVDAAGVAHAIVNALAAAAVLSSAAVTVLDTADTFAVLADEPKSPNVYPPMAANAISVAAMMRTVAMIGEMAFLSLTFEIFIDRLS